MRFFFELAFIVLVALGLGAAISQVSIQDNLGFGALRIGQWTAWPAEGSRDADPYTRAKVAADGAVPLGAGEGIAFEAEKDLQGNPLQLACSYRLAGQTPLARLWTLTAHAADRSGVETSNGTPAATNSRKIVRNGNGSFEISVGPVLQGGNWINTTGTGPLTLIFRLYDTQVTTAAGLLTPEMPSIELLGCQ